MTLADNEKIKEALELLNSFIGKGRRVRKPTKTQTKEKKSISTLKTLEQKLEKLSIQLEKENKPAKQQELIKSIDSLIDVIAKLKSN